MGLTLTTESKRVLTSWSAAVMLLAVADILLTRYGLSLGATEVNPIMQSLPLWGMAACKIVGMSVIIYISLRFKVLASLILVAGINASTIGLNIVEILSGG